LGGDTLTEMPQLW